jgi:hypothetical protein
MTPKSELNQMIIVANNKLHQNTNPLINPYAVNKFLALKKYNGYAITIAYANDDPILLSPRMSIKNLTIWLDGFISGLDF